MGGGSHHRIRTDLGGILVAFRPTLYLPNDFDDALVRWTRLSR